MTAPAGVRAPLAAHVPGVFIVSPTDMHTTIRCDGCGDMSDYTTHLADVLDGWARGLRAQAWDEGYWAGDGDTRACEEPFYTDNPYRVGERSGL